MGNGKKLSSTLFVAFLSLPVWAGRRFEVDRAGAVGSAKVALYGDSIASGFNSACIFCGVRGGSYGVYFSQALSSSTNVAVRGWNDAHAGHESSQIYREITKNQEEISRSDYVIVNGGGNDFLKILRGDFCLESVWRRQTDMVKTQFQNIANFLATNKKPGGKVRFVNMYYPLMNEYREKTCLFLNRSAHEVFLPYMIEANYHIQKAAERYGYKVADAFADLNCDDMDNNRNGVTDVNECRYQPGESLASYQFRLKTLDRDGVIRDPIEKRDRSGGYLDLMQRDNTHPNPAGHERIGLLISKLGYTR